MKLPSLSHKNKNVKKDLNWEFKPRGYWVFLLSFFVLALIVELVYFSWLFLKTTKQIDALATPAFETNSSQIRSINKTLDEVEDAVVKRTKVNQ